MSRKSLRTIPRSIVIPATSFTSSCDEGDDCGLDATSLFDFNDASSQLSSKGIYYITGEISEGSLLSIQQDLLLKHMDPKWVDDIQFFINSPGGVTTEMWALIDMMSFVKMDIQTTGMGQICSAASIILAAGSPGKRRVAPSSAIMVHSYSGYASGGHRDLVAARKDQDLEQERHISFWLDHTNLETREEVLQKLLTAVDVNLSPDEALEIGIVDEVLRTPKPNYKSMKKPTRPLKKGR